MIIVTGGAGFIGSNLVIDLLEKGYGDIVVCDSLEREEKKQNLAKHQVKEIIPPEEIFDFLGSNASEIDTIFHMGAISSTVETNINLIKTNNYDLPLKLWYWCIDNDASLLYASSAATYGDGLQGFSDDDSYSHLSSLKPLNPYGRSKNIFDIKAHQLASRGTAPKQWAGFKFFNVYGPNEHHKDGQKSVVCQMHKQINETGKVRLFKSYEKDYADGQQLRDFIFVKDCSKALLWFLENKNINGIFNIGTGQARSFNDLAKATFAALGQKEANIEYFDMPEQIKDKYQYFTEAEMSKLRDAGYDSPFTSLEEGVKDYVQNYLNKDDPYR